MQNESNLIVSVVMITYAHENYIQEAIEGIFLQQFNKSIELIIANDNSPDATDEIVKRVIKNAPQHIKVNYTYHEINKGMMPNFVWALQQTNGKYIAICEGDDYWIDPLKLQKQVDFLEKNEEYSMCFTNRIILNEISNTSKYEKLRGDFDTKNVYQGFIPFTQTTMFRNNDLILNIIAKHSNYQAGDRLIGYATSLFGKIRCIEDITAVYRFNGKGVWSSKDQQDVGFINLKTLSEFHVSIILKCCTIIIYICYIVSLKKKYIINVFFYHNPCL